MNSYPACLVGIFLCIVTLSANAQLNDLEFDHLTVDKGLSQNTILAIVKDRKGFIWICTPDGLNKYDGYQTKVYRHNLLDSGSISKNMVRTAFVDRNGTLWVGTWGGLEKYDPDTDKFIHYRHDPNNPNSLSNNEVLCIIDDSRGNIWVGTEDGLNKFNPSSNKFVHYKHDPNNSKSIGAKAVLTILEDKNKNIWAGCWGGGLNKLNQETGEFTNYFKNDINSAGRSMGSVWTIVEDARTSQFWLGLHMGAGLVKFDGVTGKYESFVDDKEVPTSVKINSINSIVQKGNELWIATPLGLLVYDPVTKKLRTYMENINDPKALSSNQINFIYHEENKAVWLGTDGGINKVNLQAKQFEKHLSKTKEMTAHNTVHAICDDRFGNYWIGTPSGLVKYNPITREHTLFINDPNNPSTLCNDRVLSIVEDKEGMLWVGTFECLSKFNPETGKFTTFIHRTELSKTFEDNRHSSMMVDQSGMLWLPTDGGLKKYDPYKNEYTHYYNKPSDPNSLINNRLLSIYQDKKGIIWLGTRGSGLEEFNPVTEKFTHHLPDIKNPNSLREGNISAISEDKEGNILLCTLSGLSIWNRNTGNFKNFSSADNLPNVLMHGLLVDDHGNAWISSNIGLLKYNFKSKVLKQYSVEDGLQNNEFVERSFFKSRAGKFCFGGINGFNAFIPDSIKDNPNVPPVVLTNFSIFNKTVPIGNGSPLQKHISQTEHLTLSYKHSVISFEFAALDFTIANKNKYAYKLEGFDENWNDVGTLRMATYTNLDPGNYIFRVKASNNDEVWNEQGTAITIEIIPPFWQTWWFRMLVGSTFVGLLISFYKIRLGSIKKQKVELQRQVANRTRELAHAIEEEKVVRQIAEKAKAEADKANQAKSIFLATMSHEIRTPMNGVIGMASLLTETQQTAEQLEYTETIKNCGEALLTVINDILDFSKIESGKMELEQKDFDLRTCIEEVLDVFATKASKIGLDLVYEIDYNVPAQIVGDSVRLRQIILNLVSNAIKFTNKGEIFVGVHLLNTNDDEVELGFEVRDTGIGIPQDKLHRLFKAFSQVDASTTRQYGGTGLGLVICEKLVGLMHGAIMVESVEGEGTKFTFTIKSEISQQNIRTYVHHNTTGLEGKKVLVIDDNLTNRNILKNQLTRWKLVATLAESGNEALAILKNESDFDLILSDMQMPAMDGTEFARRLQQSNIKIPIILLSSIGDERAKEHHGLFASVLVKPVRQESLFKHIVSQLLHRGERTVDNVEVNKKLSDNFSKQYPLRILIAEDNPVNLILAERVMVKLGYTPDKVLNGQESLDALAKKNYDIVFMDIQMPVMDGIEATKKIRQRPLVQPCIIAMTANAMQGDRDICINAGMNDYISKPFKLEDLTKLLEKWGTAIKK